MSDLLRRWNHLWVAEGECLRWIGATIGNRRKAPSAKYKGKVRYVSRLVCEEAHGPPPTNKHEAAHAPNGCIGVMCVNPDHIRWATRSENELDKPAEQRKKLSLVMLKAKGYDVA